MPKKKALLSSLESDAVLVTDACDIAASNVLVIADIMHFNSGGNNHQVSSKCYLYILQYVRCSLLHNNVIHA